MSVRRAAERELRRHQLLRLFQRLVALLPVALGGAVLLHVLELPGGIAPLAGALFLGALILTRIRRPSPAALLRRIDPSECLLTAHALEEAGDHEGLAALVHDQASRTHVHLELPWRVPRAGLVSGLVLLAAAAALDLEAPLDEALAAPPPPALDARTRDALARQAEEIARLQRLPHLSEEAREELDKASDAVEQARTSTDRREARGAMSRAQHSLSQLGDEDARLFEPQALRDSSSESLAEALAEAMDQGDEATARELMEEAMRRMEEAGHGQDLGELGDALDQLAREQGAADAEQLADRLEQAEGPTGAAQLRQLARQLEQARQRELTAASGERGEGAEAREGETLDAALSAGDGAGRQGEGSEGEGEGSQPGSPASGPGMLFASMALGEGLPGSGGPGQREAGEGDAGVRGAPAAQTWISGQWDQGPQLLLGSLEGRARGYDDPEAWPEVHRSYASVAEEVAEREQLPLSRRDYAREYFHAIRPR